MPSSFGKRARTRQKFAKGFRRHGAPGAARQLYVHRKGDFVDICCDAFSQKGMPFSAFHGRTGRVFDVGRRALGVEVRRRVRGRELLKRLHVRVEHLRSSACAAAFRGRARANDRLRHEARLQGRAPPATKRLPQQPRGPALLLRQPVSALEPAPFFESY